MESRRQLIFHVCTKVGTLPIIKRIGSNVGPCVVSRIVCHPQVIYCDLQLAYLLTHSFIYSFFMRKEINPFRIKEHCINGYIKNTIPTGFYCCLVNRNEGEK